VDAPAHFGEGAATVDLIAPDELIVPVVVVDIRARVERDHDAMVTSNDVLSWERLHGRLPGRLRAVWPDWLGSAGS
jgi:kynurenine formamidase